MKAELEGKRVLVLGLGMSGRSAANFCAAAGARVTAADERSEEQLEHLGELSPEIEIALGAGLPDSVDFDLVVPSPGVPSERYARGARRVWGDIELAFRALRVPVVAVTGTNGKSTTVRLIEAMLDAAGLRVGAAGNVGTPALELVGRPLDTAVLEVSSFQLEAVEAFAPRVAVILNLTPDHLDRHGRFEDYVAAKRRILEQQGPEDVAVLNFDDPVVRDLASATTARVIGFCTDPTTRVEPPCARLDGQSVILRDESSTRRIGLDGLPLLGRHNLENAVAAIAAVWGLGVDPARGAAALAGFAGLPHRCERVASHGGVDFVNDSKATNVGAAVRSLEGIAQPILWIAGGSDKGTDFDALADAAAEHVRRAFLIGETAPRIAQVLAGRVPCDVVGSLDEAVRQAARAAKPGDAVLLCPACASFDQFADFEARGEAFRLTVEAVLREGGVG